MLAGCQPPWQLGDVAQPSFLSVFLGTVMGAISNWAGAGKFGRALLSTDPPMPLSLLLTPPRAHLSFCFIDLQCICHACNVSCNSLLSH